MPSFENLKKTDEKVYNAINDELERQRNKIELIAYKNLDNSIGIVLFNRDNNNHVYNLCIENKVIHDNLDSHAIVSYLIK